MENLEQRYELKNLSVRQGQNGKLYISIYQGYDQESGYHTENILSNGHEIIYKFEASVNGTNYDYENARDYDDYGIVYNFATTYNRLVGGSVLDKKDFSKKELFKLDCLFNEKLKGLFSDAYVVKQHKNADYKFLKEGDIVLSKMTRLDCDPNRYILLTTIDEKHQVLIEIDTNQAFYVGDHDYKMISSPSGIFEPIYIEFLPGVENSDTLDSQDISGVSIDAMKVNMPSAVKNKAQGQPGDN